MASPKILDSIPPPEEGGLELDGLPDLLNWQLRMAHVAMFRDLHETMGELDLTQRQWTTLHLVNANPGVSQVVLAAALGTDRASMGVMVDRLEQRGLLQRQRSTTDRRRQELVISKGGKAVMARARRAITEHENHFRSCFSEKELKALMEGIEKIRNRVGQAGPNVRFGARARGPKTEKVTRRKVT